jgi:hypothetical protein
MDVQFLRVKHHTISAGNDNGVAVAPIIWDKSTLEGPMNRFVTATVIALVGGCLWAQTQTGEMRTPKATTWKGTLVDSGCRSPQPPRQKTTSDTGSYPTGTSTTSYGLITADGKCIPFDLDSNEKVSGMLKMKTDWSENTVTIKPTKVEVLGTENGGKISVEEIRMK